MVGVADQLHFATVINPAYTQCRTPTQADVNATPAAFLYRTILSYAAAGAALYTAHKKQRSWLNE